MQRARIEPVPGVVDVLRGSGPWAPVVLDSPHSGRDYPDDFGAAAPMASLRLGEDAFVDELFAPGETGAVMIAARFPRTYVDPNRASDDIDPSMLDGAWPQPLAPGSKAALGKGLVWRECLDGEPIYDRKLSVGEVAARIDRCWRPYRTTLARAIDDAYARAGVVWHVNCHSMPGTWPEGVEGAGTAVEADFVLGDRDGTTCAPRFTARVREILEAEGYRVAVNDRFKGVDIVARSGDPARGRHSLQVEVVRPLYLDETRFEPNAGFARIRATLTRLLAALCEDA